MPRILLLLVGLLCLLGAQPAQAQEHWGVQSAAHGTLEVAHPAPLPVGPLAVLPTRERPYPLSRPDALDPSDPSERGFPVANPAFPIARRGPPLD